MLIVEVRFETPRPQGLVEIMGALSVPLDGLEVAALRKSSDHRHFELEVEADAGNAVKVDRRLVHRIEDEGWHVTLHGHRPPWGDAG